MSFWPGKGLFANRNKRLQRVRLVWKPPEKFAEYSNGANQLEQLQPEQESQVSESIDNGRSVINTRSSSVICDIKGEQKRLAKNGEVGRGRRKRRNLKALSDQKPIVTDDPAALIVENVHENGGKDSGETNGNIDFPKSNNGFTDGKRGSRKKRSSRKSKKSLRSPVLVECRKKVKQTVEEEDDWDGIRDAIGPVTRSSSSSSLSSSCSNSSLIKHYTNVIMNCCDNHFKEDCDYVRAKVDRILKAHWKDRLNRLKEKGAPVNVDNSSERTDSQSSDKQSSPSNSHAFELRPARLPLNKKTWTKLRKSNQNSDWLLNEET